MILNLRILINKKIRQHPMDTTSNSQLDCIPLVVVSQGGYCMSVYVILNYFEECKEKHQEPTLEGLNRSKQTWKN